MNVFVGAMVKEDVNRELGDGGLYKTFTLFHVRLLEKESATAKG